MPGANGAGKTTFALDYLPEMAGCEHFINADLIAAGLSPLHPERQILAASRLYLAEIERRFARSLRHLFTAYVPAAHHAQCHMNDRPRADPLVFTSRNGVIEVADTMWYQHLQQESKR